MMECSKYNLFFPESLHVFVVKGKHFIKILQPENRIKKLWKIFTIMSFSSAKLSISPSPLLNKTLSGGGSDYTSQDVEHKNSEILMRWITTVKFERCKNTVGWPNQTIYKICCYQSLKICLWLGFKHSIDDLFHIPLGERRMEHNILSNNILHDVVLLAKRLYRETSYKSSSVISYKSFVNVISNQFFGWFGIKNQFDKHFLWFRSMLQNQVPYKTKNSPKYKAISRQWQRSHALSRCFLPKQRVYNAVACDRSSFSHTTLLQRFVP